jgi:hypothetical protein
MDDFARANDCARVKTLDRLSAIVTTCAAPGDEPPGLLPAREPDALRSRAALELVANCRCPSSSHRVFLGII